MTPLHDDRPTVTMDAISQYLKAHQIKWQTQIPKQGTRLFYTETQWPEVLTTLNNNEGLRPKFRADEQALIRETMQTRCNALLSALQGANFWARSYTENHNHVSVTALSFAGLAFYGDLPEAPQWLAAACINFEHVAQYSAPDGSNQRFDSQARATIECFVSTSKAQWTSIDLSQAYSGDHQVRREVLHVRNDYILSLDRVTGQSPLDVEWLAQIPASATIDQSKIQIPSPAGNLTINVLQPKTAHFNAREATSPRFDKPNPEQKSYAVAKHGEQVAFAVIMQPHFRDAPANKLNATASSSADGVWHASIACTQWQDTLIVNSRIGVIYWSSEFDALQPPELTAKLGRLRIENDSITQVFAVQSTELTSEPIHVKSDKAFSFSLDKTGQTWVLTIDSPISGSIQINKCIQLYDTLLNPVTTGESAHLAPGIYFAAPDAKSAELALQQIKSTASHTPSN